MQKLDSETDSETQPNLSLDKRPTELYPPKIEQPQINIPDEVF